MENKILYAILGGFIAIMLGLVLLQSLSGQNYYVQNTEAVTGDQFTMSNTTCVQVTSGCIDSITDVKNSTGTVTIGAGNYTLCRSSTGNYDGILVSGDNYVDTNFNGLTLNTTYQQSPNCMYVKDSGSRALMNTVIMLFILAIVVGGIYWLRQTGLLDLF